MALCRGGVSSVLLTLLLVAGMTQPLVGIGSAHAAWGRTIIIRPDGSIYPSNAPIIRSGDTYKLTSDIILQGDRAGIIIQRDNITLDGQGHTILGPGSPETMGINITNTNYITIKNTRIINFSIGIFIKYSNNNTVENNIITSNDIGIDIVWSVNNIVENNTISNNGAGIKLEDSSGITIVVNTISNNYNGIFINDSIGNVIYHNNFINNTHHVYVFDSNVGRNVWDDGYPSGGNYWSNYTDTDKYSGPDQDKPGGDGIWDHPYIIDENNIDHYPLTHPYTAPTSQGHGVSTTLIALIMIAVIAVWAGVVLLARR